MSKETVIAARNLKGKGLEKQGRITEAIKLYELNMGEKFATPFPYMRMAIFYRKQKQFTKEIQILEKAVMLFPWEDKFKARLEKAKSLSVN